MITKKTLSESKFLLKDNRSFSVRARENIMYFFKGLIFWKGRPARSGPVHTRDIEWDDIRYIFWPKDFSEKYGYLGTSVSVNSRFFNSLYPLIIALDYEAKPKWCPRWFLRFLDVFGNDRSIVRVRNRALHNLSKKLTKGITFIDWKTKWSDYDLRISIAAPKHLQNLADDIEYGVYDRGKQQELVDEILKINPNASIIWGSVNGLEKQLEELQNRES